MKSFRIGFTLLLAIGLWLVGLPSPKSSDADRLLDILKEKGILTEQEYEYLKGKKRREATAHNTAASEESSFEIQYKRGFRITSKDKQHELRIGGTLITQQSLFPEGSDALNNHLLLRRARVTFRGRTFGQFTYRLTLEGTGDNPIPSSTYLGWERYRAFRLRLGQNSTPFGAEVLWSRYNLFFLESSMISGNLVEDTSRGVYFFSDPHPAVRLRGSITNGTGTENDNNSEKDFTLRMTGRPFRLLATQSRWPLIVGGNVSIGRQPHNPLGGRTRLFLRDNRLTIFNAATEGLRTRYGADLFFNKDYRDYPRFPFSVLVEFMYERQEREGPVLGRGNRDLIRYGYSLQTGYLLKGPRTSNGLEFAVRYESIDMDFDNGAAAPAGLPGQTLDTFGVGLTYRPTPAIRLSLNGFWFDIDRPITTAADRDPLKNGDGAWAVLSGFHLEY